MIGITGSALVVETAFGQYAQLDVNVPGGITAVGQFYGPLSSYGTWITLPGVGRCWQPQGVPPGWRPYTDGQWIWTDAGWYWQSDNPWGWACDHYGNWYDYPNRGWCWVPGTEWAPAWVNWREGDGYIGWAPMAPPGLSVSAANPDFAFVPVNQFQEPIQHSRVILRDRGLYARTHELNNVRHEEREFAGHQRRIAVNQGPGMAMVEKATGHRVNAVPVQEAARRATVPARRTAAPEHRTPAHQNNQHFNRAPQAAPAERSQPQPFAPNENPQRFEEPNPAEPRHETQNPQQRGVAPNLAPASRSMERMRQQEAKPPGQPSEVPASQPGSHQEVPAKQPPAEMRGLQHEAPHNAPGGAATPAPNAAPRQPQAQPAPHQREDRQP